MATIADEIGAYEKIKARLELESLGKWVVVHDLDLIGVYDSFEAAAEDSVRRFGAGPYLVRQVGAPPVTLPASAAYRPVYGKDSKVRV